MRPVEEIETQYYLRFSVVDRPGVLARITGILGRQGISIASVLQTERRIGGVVPVVLMTHRSREGTCAGRSRGSTVSPMSA